jgi:fructose-bisphosphate aldolase class II
VTGGDIRRPEEWNARRHPEQYAEMLDRAKAGGYAYPAINAASSQSINAVLQGLTEAGSDGIIQVTTGGADYFAGHTVKGRATGALAFAKFATEVAKNYPITVALHTDHCPKPALETSCCRSSRHPRKRSRGPQPHLPVAHVGRLGRAARREHRDRQGAAPRMKAINAILEVEIGVVGGEEDGVKHEGSNEALYTTADVSRPSRRSASARTAATSPRSPSATCTACTSRAT